MKHLLISALVVLSMQTMSHAFGSDHSETIDENIPKAIKSGIDVHYISDTINPGDNFYSYVNEGWINTTSMPAGYAFYNEPWVKKRSIYKTLANILNDENPTEKESSIAMQSVQAFYDSYLNRETINGRGLNPINPDLNQILALKDHYAVADWMGNIRSNSIFNLIVQPPVDMKGGYVLTLAQYRTTGLGLPSQAHYLSDAGDYSKHRAAYKAYIRETLARAGIENPSARAADVLLLETAFAEIMWDFARLREAGASFNLTTIEDLSARAPGFPWRIFMDARGLQELETLNVGVGAIEASAKLFASQPVDSWRSFLAFHWINSHAELLPDPFPQAKYAFFDQTLFGAGELESHDEKAIEFVEHYIGDQLGQIYVERSFPPEREAAVSAMLPYIRSAFREKLNHATWMDDATRQEALKKLDAIIVEVGFPKAGPNWGELSPIPDDPIENRRMALELVWNYQKERVGSPISRYGDWNMNAHDIGMGYHQQYNKIFITAGALEAPFFDPEADMSVNFGAVGQTLSHEFGHALDDQGSSFDSTGALRNWWSEKTRARYDDKIKGLIDQFSKYETLQNTPLRSQQMIGEIVGDLVGTSVAYRAYELYLTDTNGSKEQRLDGYTGSQRFFLGAAQQTRSIATEDTLRYQALNASHPPAEFRINGIFRNFDPWYEAFDVEKGDQLFLQKSSRILLW